MRDLTRDSLLVALRGHIGRAHGVTATALCREAMGKEPSRADERAMRFLIVELRLEGHHVCAHPSAGYFLAANAEELEDTCAFLRTRSMAGLQQIAAMKRVSIPDLVGQLRLPS